MKRELTQSERRCCNTRAATPNNIDEWRREFDQLANSEKCKDCPLVRK